MSLTIPIISYSIVAACDAATSTRERMQEGKWCRQVNCGRIVRRKKPAQTAGEPRAEPAAGNFWVGPPGCRGGTGCCLPSSGARPWSVSVRPL